MMLGKRFIMRKKYVRRNTDFDKKQQLSKVWNHCQQLVSRIFKRLKRLDVQHVSIRKHILKRLGFAFVFWEYFCNQQRVEGSKFGRHFESSKIVENIAICPQALTSNFKHIINQKGNQRCLGMFSCICCNVFVINTGSWGPYLATFLEVPKSIWICPGIEICHFGIIKTPKNPKKLPISPTKVG